VTYDPGAVRSSRATLSGAIRAVLAVSALYAPGALPAPPTVRAGPAPGALPTPCVQTGCNGVTTWVTGGKATATATGKTLTVNQSTSSAILNWSSFDIGTGGKVQFNQPSVAASALNRIYEATPSQIFGVLKSNGQVYLINPNGFVFGPTANVNVGGLLASTLNITNANFQAGLVNPATVNSGTPILVSDGGSSQVRVDAGAQLSTNVSGGRLMLAGNSVDNAGTVSAPDGQVILASGQQIFLQASSDPSLRGLIVEVDAGGTTTNEATGLVTAPRGNVTMIGLAVNQMGRTSATTSVSANGSIRLVAGDTISPLLTESAAILQRQRGGTLTLGPNSVTSVTPDANSGTAVDAQIQLPSVIDMEGAAILFEGGSKTLAPGGVLNATARANPSAPAQSATPDGSRIRVDSGASISVAGSSDSVPVSSNIVPVQLRGNELADDPTQRNGPLRGQTVYVDARVGTPIANVSGEIGLIQRDINQRTSAGGTVNLDSAGDVVVASGAAVNVSGGAVTYTPGWIQTTYLVTAGGQLVNIGNANPLMSYVGVVNPTVTATDDRWGVVTVTPNPSLAVYDPGYVQGMPAGTLEVRAPTMVLQGSFQGHAVTGAEQRAAGTIVPGGQLIVGDPNALTENPAAPDFRAPAIQIVESPAPVVVADSTPLPAPLTLQLPADIVSEGGFTRLELQSNAAITLAPGTPLVLAPAASISFTAPRVEIDSSITSPGGAVSAQTVLSALPANAATAGVYVGPGLAFNLQGNWTNDFILPQTQLPTSAVQVSGGSVSLNQGITGATLSLGASDSFDVSGGAWVTRADKLITGSAGSIALSEGSDGTLALGAGIALRGYAAQGAKGGSFAVSAPRIEISAGGGAWAQAQQVTSDPNNGDTLQLSASLFSNYGFGSFTLTADNAPAAASKTGSVLTVEPGTVIDLTHATYNFTPAAYVAASADSLAAILTPALAPAYLRTGSSLTLQASLGPSVVAPGAFGTVSVARGATITGDPGSSVTLAAQGGVNFDGAIRVADGTVSLQTLQPPASQDPGFVPALATELGASALIDVAGTVVYQPTQTGLLSGTVLPGGTVKLYAVRGSIITEAGSVIDFSGSQGALDLLPPGSTGHPQLETVASAGGTLNVTAPESISLLGGFRGAAGSGTTGHAPAGTLWVTLSRLAGFEATNPEEFPTNPRVIELKPNAPLATQPAVSGLAVLDPRAVSASGVDALRLIADQVQFDDGVALGLARELIINSPAIVTAPGATASASAPYVALGAPVGSVQPQPGNGALTLKGTESVDVIGAVAFQGAKSVTLASGGVIQLEGTLQPGGLVAGSIGAAGDLTLAANEIQPSTGTTFTITDSGAASNTVNFVQSGARPATPLSVAGQLTVNAPQIVQAGSVVAPFGTITLDASGTLTLAKGSYTSVSTDGAALPYGRVDNGNSWQYGITADETTPVTAIPARTVNVSAGTVQFSSGATIDVAGGGDLSAYGWTPGTGGTKDVLSPSVSPGLYAVLPALRGQFAPYDPLYFENTGITPGATVYLSGGAGLAPGFYPLMPARYGLLPGAFLVQAVPGFTDLAPGTTAQATNGATVVSGYVSFGTTGLGGERYSGFRVEPGSYSYVIGSYTTNLASTFFAQAAATAGLPRPTLPADAGTLALNVQQALTAGGTVLGQPTSGGQAALVQLAAPAIDITPAPAASAPGVITLSAPELASWGAGRIVLGGSYTAPDALSVAASSVTIAAGSAVRADEVVLAANGSITIGAGATVETSSAATGSAPPATSFATPAALAVNGGGATTAVVALSDLEALVPQVPTALGVSGTLTTAPGAHLGTLGSLSISVPGGAQIADGTVRGNGAQWQLAAGQVVFGPAGSGPGALVLDPSLLSAARSASALTIASATTIDVAEPVSLGAPSGSGALQSLTLAAESLRNLAPGASATFGAATVNLDGTGNAPAPGQNGAGVLTVNAGALNLGLGTLAVSGYNTVRLQASGTVTGVGDGGISVPGDLTMSGAVFTGASGGDVVVTAAGSITLGASGAAPVPRTTLPTGGALTFDGQNLSVNAAIVVPSGNIALVASNAITLGNAANIDTGGLLPDVSGLSHGSNGGLVSLSAGGNISGAAGANLSVAGAQGADAGVIQVAGGGAVALAGTFSGGAGTARRGGDFTVVAGSLPNFGALNAALEAGGFSDLRGFETRTGNLDLAAGQTMTARQVTLTADSGAVSVEGTINASGSGTRGQIDLNGGTDLAIGNSAMLTANGTDGLTKGGAITLSTATGQLTIAPGAVIEAKGLDSGTLVLRAPTAGSDVAIAALPSSLSRIDNVLVEPVLAMPLSGAPGDAEFAADQAAVAAYMTGAPAILARLGASAAPNVVISPYVALNSPGDVTVGSLDLSGWRFDGVPATIALRAGGNLMVTGVIGDGFTTVGSGSNTHLDLLNSPSSSITLVAGTDFTSASMSGVIAGAAADLTIDSGAIVRTGTGDIVLAAARDVAIQSGASVYTGGLPGAATANSRRFFATYPTGGGSLDVTAGRDAVGNVLGQSPNDWLPRSIQGTNVSWGIDAAQFGWSIGALGGGDVNVRAGRDVVTLSAAVADSAIVNSGTASGYGGGNLSIQSGRDVLTGSLYVANGVGTVRAFGALGSGLTDASGDALGTMLFAGDTTYVISARGSVMLEGEISPTSLYTTLSNSRVPPNFYRYGGASALQVTSAGGAVEFNSDLTRVESFVDISEVILSDASAFTLIAPNVDLTAFGGDVNLNGGNYYLFPSERGQLSVYAARDIDSGLILMSDVGGGLVATPLNPNVTGTATENLLTSTANALHTGDTVSALFAAGRDIDNFTLALPKAVTISAGRDIRNIGLNIQNDNAGDVSILSAGRNIQYDPAFANESIIVGGGGRFDVIAGGQIDLGFSHGIESVGNFVNPNLSTTSGADVTVIAGLGAPLDAAGFLSAVVAPSPTYQTQVVQYVESVTGRSGLSYGAAAQQFLSFTPTEQRPLLLSQFFSALVASGREANANPAVGFSAGFAAIDALLPGSKPHGSGASYAGSLSMAFSQIYTLDGGNITILVPGGELDVGLANPPPETTLAGLGLNRPPSELGIVAQGPGNVDIFTLGDVNVDASRVFTLGGGNIAIWSSTGNIDAGRGAKTSVSAPPPTVTVNAQGVVTVNFSNAVAGSGIGTIQTQPDLPAGNVDLDAPNGIVNAGDAGIRAAGNLNVAAQGVVGLDNIQVGGTSTGVPPSVGNLGVTLSAASGAASSASAAATSSVSPGGDPNQGTTPLASSAMGWLDVFVTGLGEDACKPDDIECLKRQQKH
jgi:filamentous hemagglutinin